MPEALPKFGTSRQDIIDQQWKLVAICQSEATLRPFPQRAEAIKNLAIAVDKLATLLGQT